MLMTIRIPPNQVPEFERLLKIGVEPLTRVRDHLGALSPLPLTPVDLQAAIAAALGTNGEDANALAGLLLTWNQLARQRQLSFENIISGLRGGIVQNPKWAEQQLEAWDSLGPIIQELIQSPPVRTVAKAIDLTYDHANLFQGVRIITDIRPVFDDASDDQLQIDGAVISYTLRLHYDNREGEHSLSIALDEVDIQAVLKQCSRALAKAQRSKALIQKTAIPTIISGDAR